MQRPRRQFIALSGAAAVAGLATRGDAAGTSTAADARAPLALTPQVTEGPFYLDVGLLRSDITEGLRGVPLEVRIAVVDRGGAPLGGDRVDLWHCDADGSYSGFDAPAAARADGSRSRTFLRGTVLCDRDGVAVFRTIYPGWYPGRTTHLHLKVFNGARVVLTSQVFLPDALSEYLYTNLPAYRRVALRDTLNRGDGIALEAGAAAFGAVREEADRYVVSATAVVDPDARPKAERPPGPPGRPGPGGRPDAANRDGGDVRPRFQVGNQGGGMRGSFGLGGPLGGGGPGGPPGNRGRPPATAAASDGPPLPPPGTGPAPIPLRGDARVAAIVPGVAVP